MIWAQSVKIFLFSEFEDSKIAEEGLTFSNVDFSDCIMIGVGRVDTHID